MIQLLKLAIRNFLRNRRSSIISSISIMIAICLIIFVRSYINGLLNNISDNVIKLISGHIRITTKEYERRERTIPLTEAIELTPDFYNTLNNPEIMLVSPRIKFGVLLGKEELSIPALGYAIDPIKEMDISGLQNRIITGSYFDTVSNSAIMGKSLAERLNLKVGDTLTIITRTAYDSPSGMNLIIKGLFTTGIGGIDRSIFYIPIKTGQQLLDLENKATEIVLKIREPVNAIRIADDIKLPALYSVLPYQKNSLLRYLNSFEIVYNLIYFIIIIVACSTIANTMMMVIFERKKEIGMLKAMGMSNRMIIGSLITEAGIIGALGSLFGTIGGAILSYYLKFKGFDISIISSTTTMDIPYGPVIYFSPTPFIIMSGFLLGLIMTVIIAFIPVSRVIKLEPARVLRAI